jgi:uncharacterized iron-regulated protein
MVSALRIVRTADNAAIDFGTLMREVATADVVFFGEHHDDPATHEVELAVLRELGERRANLVLSLEMFERDVQLVVDNYLRGAIQEAAFLEASRPWDRYATDYKPMVEHARARTWRVIASNVPRSVASGVSRAGLPYLDTLPAAVRATAAATLECPRDQYYTRFVQQMQGHGGGVGADSDAARAIMDRYYESQCTKDETMAESIVAALNSSASGTVVYHLNGSFHSDYRLGVVPRTARRSPDSKLVVLSAIPSADPASENGLEHRDRADFVIFTLRR